MFDLTLLGKREEGSSIQAWLRHSLINAISEGRLRPGQKMPPTRNFAQYVGVSRNTITAVYEDLVVKDYLTARERLGYFVSADDRKFLPQQSNVVALPLPARASTLEWGARFNLRPSRMRDIVKPDNWQSYRYPFLYGQVDPNLFPISAWRACSRDALGRSATDYWSADRALEDDPLLIEQLCKYVLPQRGIFARPDEVMITLGTQQGLYILGQLFSRPNGKVAVEAPSYPDACNIFTAAGSELVELPIDDEGIVLDRSLADVSFLLATPTYHCPTMVTMSPARRESLLRQAHDEDFLIIEDDYEGETAAAGAPPALKSADRDGRVLYLGTMSKVLSPGVRVGYLVAPAPVVEEAKALRRLMHRSAPLNNQRTAAIFLTEGYYLSLVKTLRTTLFNRWQQICTSVARHLPDFERTPSQGGSSVWLSCPADINNLDLIAAAARREVLIENGDPFVHVDQAGRFIRLGISSIDVELIDAGIEAIAETVRDMRLGAQRRKAGPF